MRNMNIFKLSSVFDTYMSFYSFALSANLNNFCVFRGESLKSLVVVAKKRKLKINFIYENMCSV